MFKIDINADMGEGFGNYKIGNDEELMKYVSSASVACGFHAGDPTIMKKTILLAKQNNVAVGAHPGLPDLLGFGRREMEITLEDAECYIIYQISAIKGFLDIYNMPMHHVKPHGALFSMCTKNKSLSETFVSCIKKIAPKALLLLPSPVNVFLLEAAEKNKIKVVGQLYPDLSYNPDGSLRVERVKKAVEPSEVCIKTVQFIKEKKTKTITGEFIKTEGEGIGVHSDTPNIIDVLKTLHAALKDENIRVETIM